MNATFEFAGCECGTDMVLLYIGDTLFKQCLFDYKYKYDAVKILLIVM